MVSSIHRTKPGISSLSHAGVRPVKTDTLGTASSGAPIEAELSASPDVFSAVDAFFDLNRAGQFDQVQALPAAERRQFYQIVGTLLMNGYIGYETLVVDHKIERHDVTLQIGDRRLRHARVYRET